MSFINCIVSKVCTVLSVIKQSLFDHFRDFKCEEIIMAGDFNLVFNVGDDKKGGLPRTHQNCFKSNQAGLRRPRLNGRLEITEPDRPQIHVAPKETRTSLQAQFLFTKLKFNLRY